MRYIKVEMGSHKYFVVHVKHSWALIPPSSEGYRYSILEKQDMISSPYLKKWADTILKLKVSRVLAAWVLPLALGRMDGRQRCVPSTFALPKCRRTKKNRVNNYDEASRGRHKNVSWWIVTAYIFSGHRGGLSSTIPRWTRSTTSAFFNLP